MDARDFLSGVYLNDRLFTKDELIKIMEDYHEYREEYAKQLRNRNCFNCKDQQTSRLEDPCKTCKDSFSNWSAVKSCATCRSTSSLTCEFCKDLNNWNNKYKTKEQ